MNKKLGIILILTGGVILIALIIFLMLNFTGNEPDQPSFLDQSNIDQVPVNEQERPEVVDLETKETTVVKPAKLSPVQGLASQRDLERIAKSFAERFGSFSNQSNFSNIKDLSLFMSDKMKSWADSYMEKNKKENVASEAYYGMTTRAMSVEVLDFNESAGEASIMVQTRRRESIGTTSNSSKLFNQDILITFVKESGLWKVDSAYWQE